jgi:release factor glutamine methyltransferase
LLARDVRAYEPRVALDGGGDGLDVVRAVITDAARILRAGGSLLLEVGGDQLESVTAALLAAGFGDVEAFTDEEGDLRGIAAAR